MVDIFQNVLEPIQLYTFVDIKEVQLFLLQNVESVGGQVHIEVQFIWDV